MKTKKYLLILFFVLATIGVFSFIPGIFNSKSELVKEAEKYRNAGEYEKAFEVYTLAADEGNAHAMNGIGNMYAFGMGVKYDFKQAILWFEKSAREGYAPALYNLGMLHRYGQGTKPDFKKAFNYFEQAAKQGVTFAMHLTGYQLYHGQGTKQNYKKALGWFLEGAEKENTACMFFAGLCYRNGYGVKRNDNKALYWLEKSAQTGYPLAIKELGYSNPQSASHALKSANQNTLRNYFPEEFKEVILTTTPDNYIGQWEGQIRTYDRSGKHILKTKPLKLTISRANKGLACSWVEDDSTIISFNGSMVENTIIPNSNNYRSTGYYDIELLWELKKISFEIEINDTTRIMTGTIEKYSPESMETEFPQYFVLSNTNGSEIDNSKMESFATDEECFELIAYPNPFINKVTVAFNLIKGGAVELLVIDMAGQIIQSKKTTLPKGNNSIQLTRLPKRGNYIVSLICNGHKQTIKITKE